MQIRSLSLAQARRVALQAQGFTCVPGLIEPGWRVLKKTLDRMQVLQIDAINTVIRSHYLPLFSRLGHYDRTLLDKKLFSAREQRAYRRTFFEYWGHECSLLPIKYYPLFQWRRENALSGMGVYKQVHELAQRKPALVAELKRSIEQNGPLTCSELETDSRGSGMWEWSQTKQALEYLFWTGELCSAGRRGFQRLYAAPETVIPQLYLDCRQRDRLQDQMALLEISATALGVATETDLRDYFRLPAADSKLALSALVQAQRLQEVKVESWSAVAYIAPHTVVPRKMSCCALLSPFDPVVWCRARAERLFGFRYRIEIYVPKNKRVFGYWVMPFLLGDTLVARVDLKSNRESGDLQVKGVWFEENQNTDEVAPALASELLKLARWLNLENVSVVGRGRISVALRNSLNALHCG